MDPDELERIKQKIYDANNEAEDMFDEEDDDEEDSGDDEDSIDDDDDEDESSGDSDGSENKDQSMSEDKADTVPKMNDSEFHTRLTELENQIAENRFQYQSYVDIITLLRNNGELNKLREYRQKMSEAFPLTETLWLEWIKDESKYMDTEEDRAKVDLLFQRAVQDYLCN
jgi:hypothetical protein